MPGSARRSLPRSRAGHNACMSAAMGPSGPRLFSTHGVAVEEGIAVKRFRSHVDGDERRLYGDEPRREWRALKLLARYAPGLAPRPIWADLDADPPLIAMSQVPGEPLGTRPVTKAQEDAIAAALSRLHHAIPPSVLGTVDRAPNSPHRISHRQASTPHRTFPMTEAEVDRWREQFQVPDAAELRGGEIPGPPAGWPGWPEWAAAAARPGRGRGLRLRPRPGQAPG